MLSVLMRSFKRVRKRDCSLSFFGWLGLISASGSGSAGVNCAGTIGTERSANIGKCGEKGSYLSNIGWGEASALSDVGSVVSWGW